MTTLNDSLVGNFVGKNECLGKKFVQSKEEKNPQILFWLKFVLFRLINLVGWN